MLSKIKDRVARILKRTELARKSDNVLMYELWTEDMEILHQGNGYTLQTFFNDFISGRLTNTESVRRVRQQLQAKYPELRDKETYEARMKRSVLFKQEFSSRYNFEGLE
tara:strand:+ start:373 stop:699 length:327 start_codon:yes stop_codon:yes gene_type:complete